MADNSARHIGRGASDGFPRRSKMDDEFLKAVIKSELNSAIGYIGGNLTEQRRDALDQYYQEPYGSEIDGRSSVVTSDVQDTVESLMPDLMEIFAGSEQVCRFEPRQPEDEAFAAQATEYINFIWNNDNNGFQAAHDFIKDALLQKNGVMKVWWDESPIEKRETLTGVNSLVLAQMDADDDIEIIEQEEREAEEAELQFAPDGKVYDVTIVKTQENGRVKVQAIPPEEFLISRRAVDLDTADFVAHRVRRTKSDLLLQGFDEDLIRDLPTYNEAEYNEERINRFSFEEEWPEADQSIDAANEEVWLYECYVKVDYDGDGITEMRQITTGGSGYTLLDNQPVDDHPFVSITPIRMPHKFFGRSMADLVGDLQKAKTSALRQLLDNMYFINNGRMAASNRVNLDDLITNRPGGVVQIDTEAADVQGHIVPITTAPIGQSVLPLMEYLDTIRETRTGVTRYNQGIDADSLNKTASGISQILNQSQRRLMMIARVFAEMGFKPAFAKMLRLVVNNQDRERLIRLRNEWVPMDPRNWDADMDVSISVGLGHGTRQERATMARGILDLQEKIVSYQGGINGPLVTLDNLHQSLKTFVESVGFKQVNQFFSDPENWEPPPPQPDPQQEYMQMQMQIEQGKLQLEQQKAQAEAAEAEGKMTSEQQQFMANLSAEQEQFLKEMELKWAEYEAKYNVEGEKVRTAQAKVEIEGARAMREANGSAETDERTKLDATDISSRLGQVNQLLVEMSQGMAQARESLTRPKEIVRDQDGKIVGAQ